MEQPLEPSQTSDLAAYPARPPRDSIQDPAAYEAACAETDLRLKNRFEAIFSKYEHDFTDVGDEIDLETLEVVVDNGHLQHMENEADPGKGGDAGFISGVGKLMNWDEEEDDSQSHSGSDSSVNGSQDDESGDDAEVESSSGESNTLELRQHPRPRGARYTPDSAPSIAEVSSTADASDVGTVMENVTSAPGMLNHLPAIRQSMEALQASASNITAMEAFQTLGLELMATLSKFMRAANPEQSTNLKRSAGIWDYPELPAFKRQRAQPPGATVPTSVPPSLPVEPQKPSRPDVGGANASLWAPLELPSLSRKRRTRRSQIEDEVPEQTTSEEQLASKACVHCGIRVTCHWRKSDAGDLCNPCGMFYWRWGEMKPLELLDYEAQETEYEDDNYAANTSRRITQLPWTSQDDALIIKLKEIDRYTWDEIAKAFPDRGPWAQQARYDKMLKRGDCPGRAMLVEQGFTFPLDGVDFSAAEEKELMRLKGEQDLDWDSIAQQMPKFSIEALKAQHKFLTAVEEAAKREGPRPAKSNTKYAAGEDEAIRKLHEENGLSFEDIAEVYPGRTRQALQKRYSRGLAKRKRAHEELYGPGTFVAPNPRGRSSRAGTLEVGGHDRQDTEPLSDDGFSGDEDARMPVKRAKKARRRVELLDGFDYTAKYRFHFTTEDDEELKRLRRSTTLDWTEIALRFPNRSIESLKNRCGVLQTCQTVEQVVTAVNAQVDAAPEKKKKKSRKRKRDTKPTPATAPEPVAIEEQPPNLTNSLLRGTPTSVRHLAEPAEPGCDNFALSADKKSPKAPAPLQSLASEPVHIATSVKSENIAPKADEHIVRNEGAQRITARSAATALPKVAKKIQGTTIETATSSSTGRSTSMQIPLIDRSVRTNTPLSPPGPTTMYGTPRLHNACKNPYFLATPERRFENLNPLPDDDKPAQSGLAIDPYLLDDSVFHPTLVENCFEHGRKSSRPSVTDSSREDDFEHANNSNTEHNIDTNSRLDTLLVEAITEAMIAGDGRPITTYSINKYITTRHGSLISEVKAWKRKVRSILLEDSRFKQLAATKFQLAEIEGDMTAARDIEEPHVKNVADGSFTLPPTLLTPVKVSSARRTNIDMEIECDADNNNAHLPTREDSNVVVKKVLAGSIEDGLPLQHYSSNRATKNTVEIDIFAVPDSPSVKPKAVLKKSPLLEKPPSKNVQKDAQVFEMGSFRTSGSVISLPHEEQTPEDSELGKSQPVRQKHANATKPPRNGSASIRHTGNSRRNTPTIDRTTIPDSEEEFSSEGETDEGPSIFEAQDIEAEADSGIYMSEGPLPDSLPTPPRAPRAREQEDLDPKITREPLSSSPAPVMSRNKTTVVSSRSPASSTVIISSSPPPVSKKSPPKRVYRKDQRARVNTLHTPRNAASAFLANRQRRQSSTPATPIIPQGLVRGGSATRFVPGSTTKRVVETPLRDMAPTDPDEDELA